MSLLHAQHADDITALKCGKESAALTTDIILLSVDVAEAKVTKELATLACDTIVCESKTKAAKHLMFTDDLERVKQLQKIARDLGIDPSAIDVVNNMRHHADHFPIHLLPPILEPVAPLDYVDIRVSSANLGIKRTTGVYQSLIGWWAGYSEYTNVQVGLIHADPPFTTYSSSASARIYEIQSRHRHQNFTGIGDWVWRALTTTGIHNFHLAAGYSHYRVVPIFESVFEEFYCLTLQQEPETQLYSYLLAQCDQLFVKTGRLRVRDSTVHFHTSYDNMTILVNTVMVLIQVCAFHRFEARRALTAAMMECGHLGSAGL
jgi:hypothetical protein